MTEKPKRNYPFRGKIYTAEQIDNIISGITFDGYTKEETDELLDLKQNILTAGDGISIVDDTISVTGKISGFDWELVDTYDWLTGIVNIDTTNNTITFLKDVCLVPCNMLTHPILFIKDSVHTIDEKIASFYISFNLGNTSIMLNTIVTLITDIFNSNLSDDIANTVSGNAFIKSDKTISSVTITNPTTYKKYISEIISGHYGLKLYVKN